TIAKVMAAGPRAPRGKEGLRTGSSFRSLDGSRPSVNRGRNPIPLLGALSWRKSCQCRKGVGSLLTGLDEMTLSKALDGFWIGDLSSSSISPGVRSCEDART